MKKSRRQFVTAVLETVIAWWGWRPFQKHSHCVGHSATLFVADEKGQYEEKHYATQRRDQNARDVIKPLSQLYPIGVRAPTPRPHTRAKEAMENKSKTKSACQQYRNPKQ